MKLVKKQVISEYLCGCYNVIVKNFDPQYYDIHRIKLLSLHLKSCFKVFLFVLF